MGDQNTEAVEVKNEKTDEEKRAQEVSNFVLLSNKNWRCHLGKSAENVEIGLDGAIKHEDRSVSVISAYKLDKEGEYVRHFFTFFV